MTEYGWKPEMTLGRAIRVVWWRAIKGCTWRWISADWCDLYEPGADYRGNQLHGIDVCHAAAYRLRLGSAYSHIMNGWDAPRWLSDLAWRVCP